MHGRTSKPGRRQANGVSASSPVPPQTRVAAPHELGGTAVYLVSDAATYTVGSTLTVDGGWTAA
ncbi:SDR family oxidoreductase [Amycolatopsis echigonensis]|uniref:SDR family oxidoreductase n=1 Tax=Amycolatopsis echigonensis TaxID=2576905 RepID=UPI000C6FF875